VGTNEFYRDNTVWFSLSGFIDPPHTTLGKKPNDLTVTHRITGLKIGGSLIDITYSEKTLKVTDTT
jgi:hypothetical protein